MYGIIRAKALKAGVRFSNQPNASYNVLSLAQLNEILKTKTVPYLPNVGVLEALEKKIPRLTDWDDIVDNFKGTHVFHESCHLVAQTFSVNPDASEEQRILTMLLEESFANACELLSILDADDQVHRVFLELNSYVYMIDDRAGLLQTSREIGRGALLTFMLLAYLHANFLRPPSEKDFERCFALASPNRPLDAKHKKALRALSKIAFKLNPRFREVTTRFYLKLNGFKTDVASLGRFDFLGVMESSATAKNFLKQTAQLGD